VGWNSQAVVAGRVIVSQGEGATFEQVEIDGDGNMTWSKYQAPTVIIRQILANGTELIYADPGSGGPQGGLVASYSPVGGTDQFANPYQAGNFLYEVGGNAMAGLMWNTVAGSQPLLALFPDSDFGFTDHAPFILAADANKGLASEYQSLGLGPGAPPPAASSPVMLALWSASPNGVTSVPHMSVYGGPSYDLICDINENGITAANPASPNTLETWHSATMGTDWTGPLQYRLLPDGNIQWFGTVTPGTGATFANATVMASSGSDYEPASSHYLVDQNGSGRFLKFAGGSDHVECFGFTATGQTCVIEGTIGTN